MPQKFRVGKLPARRSGGVGETAFAVYVAVIGTLLASIPTIPAFACGSRDWRSLLSGDPCVSGPSISPVLVCVPSWCPPVATLGGSLGSDRQQGIEEPLPPVRVHCLRAFDIVSSAVFASGLTECALATVTGMRLAPRTFPAGTAAGP